MKHMVLHRYWGLTLLGLCCAACSEGSVPIGEQDDDNVENASFAGSWDGYIESYRFDSGSDRIRLVLDASGKGLLRFGDMELIPKPTDQWIPYYPPQLKEDSLQATESISFTGSYVAFEGFNYPVNDAAVTGDRLKLSAPVASLYEDYCALQVAPYPAYFCENPEDLGFTTCLEYSRTPYEGSGILVMNTGGCVVVYDRTPTTIDELSTIPQQRYWEGYFVNGKYDAHHNVIMTNDSFSPDDPRYEITTPNPPPSLCKRADNGVYHAAPAPNTAIELDAALENGGNALVGTLTTLVQNKREPIVRTVRLTRVPTSVK